jgi:single-strand DNA-binding protein
MVSGRLKIRDWENTDRSGTTVEIEADNLGHDLFWGTSTFTRTLTSGADESGSPSSDSPDFVNGANVADGDGWVAVSA